jgi:hypothetical protein
MMMVRESTNAFTKYGMRNALMRAFTVKELYDARYCQLMKDKHIDQRNLFSDALQCGRA